MGKVPRLRFSAVSAVLLLTGSLVAGCSVAPAGLPADGRACSDVVARALTSPDRVVNGAFSCMSREERSFWHRWAVSRDDQLVDVVRNHGLTSAGMVDGFDPLASWSSATFRGELESNQHLYLVRSDAEPGARALLVVETDSSGLVDSFALMGYDIGAAGGREEKQ